jgi:hypothetical protein
MATPATPIVLLIASLLLAVGGIALLLLVPRSTDRVLSSVALGNTSIAFVLAFWMLARWNQFSIAGRVVVALTVAAFLAVAVDELLGTFEEEGPTRART